MINFRNQQYIQHPLGARKYTIESVYLDKEGSKSKNAFLQRLRPVNQ